MKIETIHASLMCGQKKQMAEQIDAYGPSLFFKDYCLFLLYMYGHNRAFEYLKDATISYHVIKNG